LSRTDDPELATRLIAAAQDLLTAAKRLGNSDRAPAAAEPGSQVAPHPTLSGEQATWVATARRMYHARRRRDELFGGAHLFGEPAWDILLDLFIAASEGKRISITSACIGAAAPPTTALRWLNLLEREGLIEREGDSKDMRRSYVRLSRLGVSRMTEFFSARETSAGDRQEPRTRPNGRSTRLTSAAKSAATVP
jgi:hypothetical protein